MDSEHKKQETLSDNLSLHLYDPLFHKHHLDELLKKRSLSKYNHYIPKLGWAVFLLTRIPVSFMFLRTMEGNGLLFDSMISDPDVDPSIRDRANNMTTSACIEYAKANKVSTLLALTKDINTLVRARSHGLTLFEDMRVLVATYNV